ncbi:MAG: restriction endonuclease subunit S [Phycisphaerae bacterium]|nr:restriction endonuclease subunit S [Phycisphaerae bacterium]
MTLHPPPGWEECELGDIIASLDGGVSVLASDEPAYNGQHGVLKVSAVHDGHFFPEENKRILDGQNPATDLFVRAGDLFISRANTPDLVGACGMARRTYRRLYLPDKLWRVRLADPKRDSVEWLNHLLCSAPLRGELRTRASGTGRAMKNISKESLLAITVLRPPRAVQNGIAAVLTPYANAESLLDRLIEAKRRVRDGLAAELLTGRRRLPSFSRLSWRDVRLGDVTCESTRRNRERLGADRVMAVTKSVGLTPMREQTMSDSLARYKVLRPGGFAYNPMRLNIGSIARSSLKRDVLVSPDYVVFEVLPDSLDPRFLDYTRRAHAWRRFMMAAGSGGVRVRIYYDDLARMKLRLPGKEEQSAIADILDTAFQEIACLALLRETVAKQKRGLMQGLLTGKIKIKEDSHG